MKFAAIADIHGNSDALEAVLADIAALGIADVVNLGDHVSGPMEARRTANMLIARGFPSIAGDQDRRIVALDGAGDRQRGDVRQLERRHLDWLASLPSTLVYREQVFLCHGTPRDDEAYWLDHITPEGAVGLACAQAVEAEVAGLGASLFLCGHSHLPRAVRMRDGRLVVNPGSVGLPAYRYAKPFPHVVETGTPDACYAVLEQCRSGWAAAFRHVPYDSRRMADLARRARLPEWANALTTGRIGS